MGCFKLKEGSLKTFSSIYQKKNHRKKLINFDEITE